MRGETIFQGRSRFAGSKFALAALLCACSLLSLTARSFAVTHCGAITSNQVWAAADNPHVVTCDVIVNTGVTLTIQAGAVIRFQSGKSMIVNGSLKAIGAAMDSIYFTSWKDTVGAVPSAVDWKQILFTSSSVGDSLLYCEFRYGGYRAYDGSYPLVAVEGCSPVFISCTVRDAYLHGMKFTAEAHAFLKDCAIYDNSAGVAIWADVSSIPIWEGDYGPDKIHDNISGGAAYNGIYIPGGTITENTHWTRMGYTSDEQYTQYGIPFFIGGDRLIVWTGTTLRMDPGTRLNFCAGVEFRVDGALKAVGTNANNILFTSYKDVTGVVPESTDWKQVLFTASSTGDSLVYCQFRYGGYRAYDGSYPLVAVEGCSPVFINCTMRNGYLHGVKFTAEAHAFLRDCVVYDNDGVAIWSDVSSIPIWEGDYGPDNIHDNIFGGAAYNGIYIPGGTITANTHWTRMGYTSDAQYTQYGIPFFVGGDGLIVSTGTTLRMDPGTRLNFCVGVGLRVAGALKAVGTSSNNILFTSYKDVTGVVPESTDWKQVLFLASSTSDSLVYCQFRYGGYKAYEASYPLVTVEGCSPVFVNCRVWEGQSHGMSFASGAHPLVKDCRIYNNDGVAMYVDLSSMPVWEGFYGPLYIFGNTYGGVAYNGIYIPGGTISQTTHWSSMGSKSGSTLGLPIYIGGNDLIIGQYVTLELDAGVQLLFTANRSLIVNGTLNAIGKADKRVLFGSYLDSPTTSQYWKQILYNLEAGGTLEFCEIKYAGYSNNYALLASASSPTIQHCTIRNCTIGLIKAENGGCPIIHYSTLLTGSTTKYAILTDCACSIDARFNYYGDPTGPYHPTTNPAGLGSRVSDCVAYIPWWESAFGVPDIAVRPDKIGQAVQLNTTYDRDLRIINRSADSVLSFSISEGLPAEMVSGGSSASVGEDDSKVTHASSAVALVDLPWVSATPASGLVGPGDTTHVIVTFDAAGMECPSYHLGYLIIHSNDPEKDPIIVPLDMEVINIDAGCDVDSTLAVNGAFCLGPNYPNPFNPLTTLTYRLSSSGPVKLLIYDVQGRRVKCLVDGSQGAGAHTAVWDGRTQGGIESSSGVYFVRLEAQGQVKTRKIIMAR